MHKYRNFWRFHKLLSITVDIELVNKRAVCTHQSYASLHWAEGSVKRKWVGLELEEIVDGGSHLANVYCIALVCQLGLAAQLRVAPSAAHLYLQHNTVHFRNT